MRANTQPLTLALFLFTLTPLTAAPAQELVTTEAQSSTAETQLPAEVQPPEGETPPLNEPAETEPQPPATAGEAPDGAAAAEINPPNISPTVEAPPFMPPPPPLVPSLEGAPAPGTGTTSEEQLNPAETERAQPETGESPTLPPPPRIIPPPADAPGNQSETELPGGSWTIESPNGVLYDQARGLAVAQGNVVFRYREFAVIANQGVVDYNTNKAYMKGNLTVQVRGREFTGESLTFDLDTGTWTLSQLETIFPPEIFPPGTVLAPIFAEATSITGDAENVRGADIKFSSCDRDHYYFMAKKLEFYRDANGEPDRIALKKNALYAFGRKLLPLPVYIISLQGTRSRRYGLQPTFGQNDFDGFFVRSVYDLGANQRRTDTLLLDALQKRGLGLGFQRELANGAGLAYLYFLTGKGDIGRQVDARLRREWKITDNLRSSLNFQSTRNSSESGAGLSSRNGELSFVYGAERINSNLFLRFNQSGTSGGQYNSNSATFQHQQTLGNGWTLNANSLYNASSFGETSNTATLDNTLAFGRQGSLFDSLLRLELHDDLTGNNRNGAYLLERLPELTFASDSKRLGISFLDRYLPGRVELSIGQFNEPASLNQQSRLNFLYRGAKTFQLAGTAESLPTQVVGSTTVDSIAGTGAVTPTVPMGAARLRGFSSQLNIAGGFGQAFYSDNTARYNYDLFLNWTNRLGPFGAQLNYNRQRNEGFTPFFFDFLSPGEALDTTLFYQPSDKLRFNLTAGRDFQNNFTRDLVGLIKFVPSPAIDSSFGFTYSPERKELGDLTANLRLIREPEKFLGGTIDVGLRFTPEEGRFSRINTAMDVNLGQKTRIQALLSYNGFASQFDLSQIRVARDLHCFNLFATIDTQRKQVRFDLALKAFPFLDTRFGQGQYGTGFDPYLSQAR